MAEEELKIKVILDGADEATKRLDELADSVDRVSKNHTGSTSSGNKASLRSASVEVGKVNKLLLSFGRIAFYRAVRTAVKSVTDAIKEGLSNAYQFSQAINGSLAQSLDNLSTKSLTMKNQLGSAFSSLLQAISPILISIINLVTKAANVIAQFFAAFSGSTYLKANDVFSGWADTAAAGASATEEWKNQLLGFDEINKLEDNSTGGTGSGGGGSNIGDMFSIEEISQPIKDFVQWIEDHLDAIKAICVGIGAAILAWKLSSGITSLLANGGTIFAKILSILKTVAAVLLTVVGFALAAYEYFDMWTNGIDWENLLKFITGIEIAIIGLSLQFGVVGAAVALVVGGIALLVVGIKEWIENGYLSVEAMTAITVGLLAIGTAIALLTGSWIPILVAAVVAAVVAIVAVVTNNLDEIEAWIVNTWDNITSWCTDALNNIEMAIVNGWNNIKSGTSDALNSVEAWIVNTWSNIKNGVANGINWILNKLESFFSWLPNKVASIGSNIVSAVNNFVSSIISAVQNAISAISNLLSFSSSVNVSASTTSSKTRRYASGGTPEAGSLFIAGEQGAELISSAGGTTSVSNMDQLANSVSVGNEGVISAIYSMANAIVKSVDSKNTDITLDGMSLARNMYKYNNQVSREHGKALINYNYT